MFYIKNVLKSWLTKLKNNKKLNAFKKAVIPYISKLNFHSKIPENYKSHVINVEIMLAAYFISSLIIYPGFDAVVFFKEIFSLLCVYGAIFCWFFDKLDQRASMKICLVVNACIAPIIFFSNPLMVSIFFLLALILFEYILLKYVKGCNFFKNAVPVYVVCESKSDANKVLSLMKEYKVLELILLNNHSEHQKDMKLSCITSCSNIRNYLQKISRLLFYPTPRRLIYFAERQDSEHLSELIKISVEQGIPLFKADAKAEKILALSPIALDDLYPIAIPSADKTAINSLFKNKNVWICFDGKKVIENLIVALTNIAMSNLTILCDNEQLAAEIDITLAARTSNSNYRVKVVNLELLLTLESAPDILLYNLPMKSRKVSEDHLKESFIQNVIYSNQKIKIIQEAKIPMTFVVSNNSAMNANNWIGATARLGELLFQYADFQHSKLFSKFRVIRIPESVEDKFGLMGEIESFVYSFGKIEIDSYESELNNLYLQENVFPLFVKAIAMAAKNSNSAEVLTVLPKDKTDVAEFINKSCAVFGIKYGRDIKLTYNHHSEAMELNPNVSEQLEKTAAANIYKTKFIASAIGSFNTLRTIDEIKAMSSREVIATVFQDLADRISPKIS